RERPPHARGNARAAHGLPHLLRVALAVGEALQQLGVGHAGPVPGRSRPAEVADQVADVPAGHVTPGESRSRSWYEVRRRPGPAMLPGKGRRPRLRPAVVGLERASGGCSGRRGARLGPSEAQASSPARYTVLKSTLAGIAVGRTGAGGAGPARPAPRGRARGGQQASLASAGIPARPRVIRAASLVRSPHELVGP